MSATANNFGMKERVLSLICVAAWNRLTTRPTISAVSNNGEASSRPTYMAWCAIDMTDSGVIFGCLLSKALRQRPDQQLPPIHENEPHQLERQRNRGGRHHHHAHRHQHTRHHHVDDEKRNEYREANL